MYLRSRSLTALLSIATVLLGGCLDRPLRPLNPCTVSGVVNEVAVTQINQIDLLFLVDNSFSMLEEQSALVVEIPRLVQILATGDLQNGGTTSDFDPVASIQVGVITSDMGIGGVPIAAQSFCTSNSGDDGILVDLHRGTDVTCPTEPATPPFLTFMTGDNATDFADSVGCLAQTGSNGCAFEMQLEAVLKALTPADSAIRFPRTLGGVEIENTAGHGGTGFNSGFLRENSLLAIIMVTDEDDCSTSNMDLFVGFENNSTVPTPFPPVLNNTGDRVANLQCKTYRDAQYDVMSRYVQGILALRPGQEDFTIFATISGVDPDVLEANSETTLVNGIEVVEVDIPAILDDPTMEERQDANASQPNLIPGCVRPNPVMGGLPNRAFPPRRLLEVTEGLKEAGVGGVVASICQAVDPDNGDYTADFGPAVTAIAARIAASLPTSCLPRELIRNGANEVTCQILEVLPVGATCAQVADTGRDPEPVRFEGEGENRREVCRVEQIPVTPDVAASGEEPAGLGWYYDDYSDELATDCVRFDEDNRQQIRFTTGAESIPGSKFRLECLSPVIPTGDRADIGTSCAGSSAGACDLDEDGLASLRSQYDRAEATLICDDNLNTCQLGCEVDADCPGGYVCYGSEDGNAGSLPYCISPTCQL